MGGPVVECLIARRAAAQLNLAVWTFPNNPDDAVVDVAVASNSGATITTVGGTGALAFNTLGATTQSASCSGWNGGSGLKWWQIQLNTIGYRNLEVFSKQRSSATGPRDFVLQYRIGAAGAWTAVPGAPAIAVGDNFTSGVLSAIPLPAVCEDQASVFLRWLMVTDAAVGGGTVAAGGTSRIDDIHVQANSNHHFRSIGTGDWSSATIWKSSPTGMGGWGPRPMRLRATRAPSPCAMAIA